MSSLEPLNIRLAGPEWTPPGYKSFPEERRKRWWSVLGHAALIVKRAEILRGIGKDGDPLKPVKRTKGGPPLIPHGVSSRTYRLLALTVGRDGATLFWHGGWKTIIGYHAYKHGPRSLPVRNTIGISPLGRAQAMRKAISLMPVDRGVIARSAPKNPAISRKPKEKSVLKPTKVVPKVEVSDKVQSDAIEMGIRLSSYGEGDRLVGEVLKHGDQVSRRQAAYDRLSKGIGELMARERSSVHGSSEFLEIQRDLAEYRLAFRDAMYFLEEAKAKARSAALSSLKVEETIGFGDGGSISRNLTKDVGGRAREALQFLNSITVKSVGPVPDIGFKMTWLRDGRPYHQGGTVHLHESTPSKVVAHEIGHFMDEKVPGVFDASMAFLNHRVGDEKLTPMRSIGGDDSYSDDEMGRKDRFDDLFQDQSAYYVGKHYDGATEVLSMGIEKLYDDPIGMAAKDPEYFKFVVGVLRGDLRIGEMTGEKYWKGKS